MRFFSWESQLKRALREWLLDRLESYFDFNGRMASKDGGGRPAVAGGAPSSGPVAPSALSLARPLIRPFAPPSPPGEGGKGALPIALVSISQIHWGTSASPCDAFSK